MAILQIGRAFDGVDVDVATAKWSGRQLSLAGDLYLGAVTAANRKGTAAAIRDRLLALVNSRDEAAVPVVWSEDSSVDGWYRVGGATVDYTAASLNDGYAAWGCELELIDGLPQHEIVGYFGVVNNDVSLTNTTLASTNGGTIVGVPGSALDLYGAGGNFLPRDVSADITSRTSSDGTVKCLHGSATSLPSEAITTYTADPADAYEGACTLRGTYAGIADTLCLGRGMEPLGGSGLKLSNGLIRCGFNASGAIVIEAWDAGAWRTVGPSSWPLTASLAPSGTTTFTFNCATTSGVQILRNAPEQVSVRLFAIAGTLVYGRFWLDVTVRRGSRIVEFLLQSDTGMNASVAPSTGTASTTITGGLRQTSNDANGNQFVVVGSRGRGLGGGVSYAWQASTGTGALTQGVVISTEWWGSAPFGIGCCVDGSSATGINTAQNVAYEFFAGRSETQRVVAR